MTTVSKKYETSRTRALRAGKLNSHEKTALSNIEEFGCSILHVKNPNEERPFFSYTLGLFDTTNAPELITVGLRESTAQAMLNKAAKQMRVGVDLSKGRYAEMIGNVDCEFRAVDPKWIPHLMLSAIWYNGNANFPVLQAVYPDLANRFPEDEGFNEYFAQPLLQPGAPMRQIEEDFWASNDPDSSLFNWKFPDPPHTRVFLSETVHSGEEAITYVSHDVEDGAWQFLGDRRDEGGGPVISRFHHPIDKDRTLIELADLPLGWYAERTRLGEPWILKEHPPAKDEEEQVGTEA